MLGAALMVACSKDDHTDTDAPQLEIQNVSAPAEITVGQTATIDIRLGRLSGYGGRVFMRYTQSDGNGIGTLVYNGSTVHKGELVELATDRVSMRYTPETHNYHRLEFAFMPVTGEGENVSVVMNKNKEGIDDYGFTVAAANKEAITYYEQTPVKLTIKPSPLYDGKYYFFYDQQDSHGRGTLTLGGQTLAKGQEYELSGLTTELQYRALTTGTYHQIDFSVYDEGGRWSQCSAVFNEELKPDPEPGFNVTWGAFSTRVAILRDVVVGFKITPSGKYDGNYYFTAETYEAAEPVKVYMGKSTSGSQVSQGTARLADLDQDGTLWLCFTTSALTSIDFGFELTIRDEDDNTFTRKFQGDVASSK